MQQNPYSAPSASLGNDAPRAAAKSSGMEPNIKTARAHFALACLYGVVALLCFGLVASDPKMRTAGFVMLLVMGLIFMFHFAISRGARARKNWARILSLIVGFLALPGFPLGTIIGIYLIAHAWSEWVEPRTYSGDLTSGWPGARGET